jgi:hypothetical protein
MKVTDTWRTVHDLISEFYKLQPWSFLEETDIFGIHSPLSDKKYFISVMGSTGTLHALSAYDGPKALHQFWAVEESGDSDYGEILTIPHTIVSFNEEELTDVNQLEMLRSIHKDFGYTVEFPEVKCILPCQFPKDPDESQLKDVIIILEQALDVCRRAKEDPDLLIPDEDEPDEYLMREITRTKNGNTWTDNYRKIKFPSLAPKVKWQRKFTDELISLPASKAVLQLHYQVLPLKVKGEGDTIYFPVTVIMTNKKTGYIENNQLLTPDPDYDTILGLIPDIVFEFIKTLGFRPRCIEVKKQVLFEMLYEPMKLTAIKLIIQENLQSVEEAVNHFIASAMENDEYPD